MRYIQSLQELSALEPDLRRLLAADPRLALDTEFIRERSYTPVLEIVQIAADEGRWIALVDVPALGGDLGTLRGVLLDPGILKIVHAGSQDVEILTARLGATPEPLYDTQIAAAFSGHGLQAGYGALVHSALKVSLSKEEGFSDWSRRPLTPAMCAYAENDVRYLHALHERLSQALERRGRSAWAEEQMRRTLGRAAAPPAPGDLWRAVSGRSGLNGRELAVLRELAIWRDSEAQRRDKPRRSVLKDEPLVELARRKPRSAAETLALRGMPPGLGERTAAQLAEAVQRGLEAPPLVVESSPPLDEQGGALVELLSAVVKVRALEEKLPPSLLASSDELRALALTRARPDFAGPLFTGWRGTLIGGDLKAALEGTLAIAWDRQRDRLVGERR